MLDLPHRLLHSWRMRLARAWVPRGANVLDIGCRQGEFLAALAGHIGPSVGIDPLALTESVTAYRLQPEPFEPPTLFADASFDVIVLLATLDQLTDRDAVCHECFRLLRSGGRVVVTLPSARGSWLAGWYRWLRGNVAQPARPGGFDTLTTPRLFGRHGFILEYWQPIQLGLNYLFVLRKPPDLVPTRRPARPTDTPIESAVHV